MHTRKRDVIRKEVHSLYKIGYNINKIADNLGKDWYMIQRILKEDDVI